MKFRLITVLWLFALLASAMGTFGPGVGIACALAVVAFWLTVKRVGSILLVLLVVSTLLLFSLLFLPAVQSAREAARRGYCHIHMRQIVLSLHNYYDRHGRFPPAYTLDDQGRPLHSWRVLILPYLEEQALYDAIRLDEPWDSPHNQQFADQIPDVYRCPSCVACAKEKRNPWNLPRSDCTHYFAVVGSDTVMRPGVGLTFSGISDGSSNTAVAVEASDRSVNWMAPQDLSTDEAVTLLSSQESLRHVARHETPFQVSYYHAGGLVGFADGRVRYLPAMTAESAQAILTAASGEQGEMNWDARPRNYRSFVVIRWGHVSSFVLFVTLSLAPMLQRRQLPKQAE